MRIPLVDWVVDYHHEAKPRKIKYVVSVPIEIKRGQQSGRAVVPCPLNSQTFALRFPSGLTYVWGDREEEEESKEVTYKSCPAVGIQLPDIADKDMVIPVEFGFKGKPFSWFGVGTLFSVQVLLVGVFVWTYVQVPNPIIAIGALMGGVWGVLSLRSIQRQYQFFRAHPIKKVG